jgi:hypothetical protein
MINISGVSPIKKTRLQLEAGLSIYINANDAINIGTHISVHYLAHPYKPHGFFHQFQA